ncbi:MAG: DNA alkylation repair protein, partial [Promethearchaeota archaeon]
MVVILGFSKKRVQDSFMKFLEEEENENNNLILNFFISEGKGKGKVKGQGRGDPEKISIIIEKILQKIYESIPQNERVGKGSVYISKAVAPVFLKYLIKSKGTLKGPQIVAELPLKVEDLLVQGVKKKLKHVNTLMPSLIAEYLVAFPEKIDDILEMVARWTDIGDWELKEICTWAVIKGLKVSPENTLNKLMIFTRSPSENVRRLVSESTRPRTDVKWLRDPTKNDKIISLLYELRYDPSLYVRKSVGNNLKDLSKYMPEKVLKIVESWLNEAHIEVSDDLA